MTDKITKTIIIAGFFIFFALTVYSSLFYNNKKK